MDAMGFRQRLAGVMFHLRQAIQPLDNLGCLQVWMPAINQAGMDALQKQLYTDPELCIMGTPALMDFRVASCQSLHYGHQGMPGRVLRSGCVQVVQNIGIIPEVLHPRCRLSAGNAASVGEVLYIPVFDLHVPHAGPVAVLEALLSATATDSMLVANFISVVGNVLSCMQLSLCNPLPQPVRRSKLEGRKPRPIHTSSSQDLTQHAGDQQQQQPHPAVQQGVPAAAAQHPGMRPVQPPAQLVVGEQQQQLPNPAAAPGGCGFVCNFDTQQQQELTRSCSGGSAGTIVVAGTPTSPPTECTLSSTLSSRLQDSCSGHASTGQPCLAAAAGCMLPPRGPCSLSTVRAQHSRRRWQQECDAAGAADGSEDSDDSPPPCKLRRTSIEEPKSMFGGMARTKSVPLGLDAVLLEAMGGSVPTASC